MVDLAERREPHSRDPRAIWAELDELREIVKFLRSAQDVVGRATISGGRSLIVDDGGGVRVKRGGNVAAEYPSGPDAALWGRLSRDLDGDLVYGVSALGHNGHTYFWAYHYDDPDDNGHVQAYAEEVEMQGRTHWLGGVADNEFGGGQSRFFEATKDYLVMQWTAPSGFPNFVKVDDTGVVLQAVTGTHRMPGMGPTGAAANLVIDFSTGVLKASVSSLRYKQDVEAAEVDVEKVLQLVPRRFRMKAEVEELGDEAPIRVGFIAEEAHELGLTDWVTYNPDGEPDAFDYPTFCVAQQAALADLAARVEALEAKTIGG